MPEPLPLDAVASEPVHWEPCWSHQLADHPSRLRWHADGRRLAAASLGGDVTVFEPIGGDIIDTAVRPASALCLDWVGDRLVTGYDDGTLTIDDRSVRLGGWIHAVATRPTSTATVAIAHGRHLSLIDADGDDDTRRLAEHPTSITTAAWHPEEPALLIGSHNRLEWCDITRGDIAPVEMIWGGAVASLHRGGIHDWWVAGVRGDWSYTWRLGDPANVHTLPVPRSTGTLVAVDPQHPRCVIASPQMTALFDMVDIDDHHQPTGHWLFSLGSPTSVAWHPTRPVLLSGVTVDGPPGGAGILRWEPERDPVPIGCILTPHPVVHLDWSPDGTLLAVGLADGTVAVLDTGHVAP